MLQTPYQDYTGRFFIFQLKINFSLQFLIFQGAVDLSGALCGADQRIVAFFKRSSLDVAALSKIWSLADVNEDGWLDLNEFSIAMHLVVLRVKGEVPIPDALPSFAKPPLSVQRGAAPERLNTTKINF